MPSSFIPALILTGCASKGFQYPGPLRVVGAEPPPYAEELIREEAKPEQVVTRIIREKKKKTTLDNFGMRVKVPEITGSISLADIQNEMDMDDIGEIVKSNSVTTLLQHYRDAEKKKDKQLMKIKFLEKYQFQTL